MTWITSDPIHELKVPNATCVVKVGDGRGFVFKHVGKRVIITAAHCLPRRPRAIAVDDIRRRTYRVLGDLHGEARVAAECLFVNPIADIAVLGSPAQEFYKQARAYDSFVEDRPALRIGQATNGDGWVLSLDGKWIATRLEVSPGFRRSFLEIDATVAGQSGSPILNSTGRAVGVVVIGCETIDRKTGTKTNDRADFQVILTDSLPGWLLRKDRKSH
jgi:hypothetical protein